MKKLRVALLGFGGIARSHYAAYLALEKEGFPISLVAICDRDAAQFSSSIAFNLGNEQTTLRADIHTYTDIDELLANEDFDAADICLPTFLHKDITVKLLAAGKHVLCEKPMSLSSGECEEMLAAAKAAERCLMIGQCLRFDDSYRYLKQCIESGIYGKLRMLSMHRYSTFPRWGNSKWFETLEKSGGCIIDTHIHDIDMARFLLGWCYS